MELWFIFAAGGVFLGGIIVYVAFMIFLPEWVGIAGKVARDAERTHQEGEVANEDDFISRMQKK